MKLSSLSHYTLFFPAWLVVSVSITGGQVEGGGTGVSEAGLIQKLNTEGGTVPIAGNQTALATNDYMFVVYPEEYPNALRNPLKGFRPEWHRWDDGNRFMTLGRHYIRWNSLEESKDDDLVANIKAYSAAQWGQNIDTTAKVIPRVYLDWGYDRGDEYWPADMKTGDYSSPQFKRRLLRMIQAMGEVWDNDPGVAWVQMGLIGHWGEQHGPHADEAMQQLLGNAFEQAFQNKKVLVRHANEFKDFEFGVYWDSWAHIQQMSGGQHGLGLHTLNETTERWKTHPIEGEIAYDWGDFRIQPGDDPNDSLRDPKHREFIIDSIRKLHCTALGWVANYDQNDPEVAEGAEAVQKAFGYRFLLEKFAYTPSVEATGEFSVQFSVRNTGSAPFYENWPVWIHFLDPESHQVVWSQSLGEVDIRSWLPGDDWDAEANLYRQAAESYEVAASFPLVATEELPVGEYIVALSIPDPSGRGLGVRLAIRNYFEGDFHPLGKVAIGVPPSGQSSIDPALFSDPMDDSP